MLLLWRAELERCCCEVLLPPELLLLLLLLPGVGGNCISSSTSSGKWSDGMWGWGHPSTCTKHKVNVQINVLYTCSFQAGNSTQPGKVVWQDAQNTTTQRTRHFVTSRQGTPLNLEEEEKPHTLQAAFGARAEQAIRLFQTRFFRAGLSLCNLSSQPVYGFKSSVCEVLVMNCDRETDFSASREWKQVGRQPEKKRTLFSVNQFSSRGPSTPSVLINSRE